MVWNWLWTLKSITINNCDIGIDVANGGKVQTVGSLVLQDSKIMNTRAGILTSFANDSTPVAGGTLVVDNVDFSGSGAAVMASASNVTILPGNTKVISWIQGESYEIFGINSGIIGCRTQGSPAEVSKPKSLLNEQGSFYERSRPQYDHLPAESFLSFKDNGATGDGKMDDTEAIQALFDRAASTGDCVV